MVSVIELGLSILVILLSLEIWYRKRPKNYPPGPLPLPVLGNMIKLLPNPLKALLQLHEKYGKILALDLGYYRVVVVNDINLVRELYQMEASNGSPLLLGLDVNHSPSGKPVGLVALDGDEHTKVQRLVRKSLKEITGSIPVIEDILQESTDFVIQTFDAAAKAEEEIYSHKGFQRATINSVWRWITGQPADPNDPDVSQIIEITLRFFDSIGSGHPSFFFPWICKIAPGLSGWTKVAEGHRQIDIHLQKTQENHNLTFHRKEERMSNLMDVFQEEIQKTTDSSSPFYKELGYLNARATYMALLYGGIETTNAVIGWAVLHMLKTPGAQEKLQREIDEIIGYDRRPSVSDRYRMPFTMSFLNETSRISPVAPLGLPRRLIHDINFHGFILRKDTIILPNIYGCHHDKTVWGADADEFKADRFLNENTSQAMLSNLLHFGSGQIACPGETLARLQIFLALVAILQLFSFHVDDAESIRSDGDIWKNTVSPFPFPFKVKRRSNVTPH